MALQQPDRVLSLTLYEPAAFGVLPLTEPREPASREISETAARLDATLDRSDDFGAARGFCAYWQGRDLWPAMDAAQQLRVAEAMPTLRRHFEALFTAPWSSGLLDQLRMPVQLICGTATRASAHRVALQLPRARLQMLEGAGHMAPITDGVRVNALLLQSLARMPGMPALRLRQRGAEAGVAFR